jgi:ADP-heptose:LPS heptosyltransferase
VDKNILLLSLTRMGDLVQSTPLIKGLREKNLHARITIFVSSDFSEFARRIPHVDEVIVLNMRQFMNQERPQPWIDVFHYLKKVMDELKAHKFDRLINLSHSRLSALMNYYLAILNMSGFSCTPSGSLITGHPWMQYFGIEPFNRALNPFNLVEIFSRSGDVPAEGQSLSLPVREEDRSAAKAILNPHSIQPGEWIIGIQAGSSKEGRRWPAESFSRLADQLVEKFHCRVIFFGVDSERALAEKILQGMTYKGRALNLTGKTNLSELTGLLGECRYLVSNDTGTMHIAAALGVTVVGLFFAHAHPLETGPYGPGHLLFQARIPCSPCSYAVNCDDVICVDRVLPEYLVSMIALHVKSGEWVLPDHLMDAQELHIFRTGFGRDQRLDLFPLIQRPPSIEDVFRICYSRLWLCRLNVPSRSVGLEEVGYIARTLEQNYDLSAANDILPEFMNARENLLNLNSISRQGVHTTRAIRENCRKESDSKQMQGLGERIQRIDKRIQDVGNITPVIKPLTDMFQKRKENIEEESIAEMAFFSQAVYDKLTHDCVEMVSLLEGMEAVLAKSKAEEAQSETSISALVPGR